MSEFNKMNNGEGFDESIDFMMKRRKQSSESDVSSGGAAQRTPVNGNGAARSTTVGASGTVQRSSVGGNPAGQRPPAGANDSGQRVSVGGNGTAQRTPVGGNGAGQRNPVGGNGTAQRTPGGGNGTAQRAPVGGNGTAQRTPGGGNGTAHRISADNEQRRDFVTSGQRIVQKDKTDAEKNGARRPINIKRTNDEVDNQATRKTDMSERVGMDNGKNKKKKSSSDLGSEMVISMVKAVIYLVFVAVVAVVLSIFIINVGNDVFAFVKSDETVEITIPENATTEDVAEILYQNGIIKYKGIFTLYGNIKDIEENYVAGTFTVSPMMNYKSLIYELKPKPVSGTSWVTVPEGFTVDEIIDLMISYGIGGTKEDYADVINNGDFDYWFVEELETNGWSSDRFYRLEGYLFPDTYEFYNASDAYTVINKMLKRFSEVYTSTYKARAEEIGFTTDQVVTLASMIEKEAGFSSDFRNVSSVFHNRLNSGGTYPRMESDATVVYAIHHLTGERPTDVTGETISFESPYNTYQNNGLPPGAIANPGMNALKYALYPADTNYYFFVSSKSGTTLFASTVAGHEANKQAVKDE